MPTLLDFSGRLHQVDERTKRQQADVDSVRAELGRINKWINRQTIIIGIAVGVASIAVSWLGIEISSAKSAVLEQIQQGMMEPVEHVRRLRSQADEDAARIASLASGIVDVSEVLIRPAGYVIGSDGWSAHGGDVLKWTKSTVVDGIDRTYYAEIQGAASGQLMTVYWLMPATEGFAYLSGFVEELFQVPDSWAYINRRSRSDRGNEEWWAVEVKNTYRHDAFRWILRVHLVRFRTQTQTIQDPAEAS